MLVSTLLKDQTKGGIKHNNVFDDGNNNGATGTDSGFPTQSPITMTRAKTTTSTLTELVTEHPKDAVWHQVLGTVGECGSYYS